MKKLTMENYHSKKANQEYMSVSQFKNFIPLYGGCEAKAMAILEGDWEEETSSAFLLGNYVHAWNENRLEEFKEETPELFKKNGELYAKYSRGNDMIQTLENDDYISQVRAGGKEKIFTAELFGIPWKCRIDIYNPEMKTFSDLKTTRDINKKYYNQYEGEYQNFIEFYGYHLQMALYAEIEKRARGGSDYYMPHIIVVDKQDPPDKMVVHFGTEFIQSQLLEVEMRIDQIKEVWEGKAEPSRCETCEYCRATKKIQESIFYKDLVV